MHRTRQATIPIAALLLAACAAPSQNPAQAVYQVQGQYAAALQLAVKYRQLPACEQPTRPVLCASAAVVVKLQTADDVAFAALTSAQNIVRTPGAGANAQTAIVAAQNAVAALTSITSTLGVAP